MTPFEITLSLIQTRLQGMLRPEYRRVIIQGSQKPSLTTLIITYFDHLGNYEMRFMPFKNFRNFRATEPIDREDGFIDEYVNQISRDEIINRILE